VYSEYEKRINESPWNQHIDPQHPELPIMPVLHGTDLKIAEKICQTGFATTSSLDAGYYGQGMYFSTYALYCLPYFCTRKEPVILLCYALPGNIFPVVESPKAADHLVGAALKTGYQSHYILTNRQGEISDFGSPDHFDELVIPQESQVIPAYILRIGKANLVALGKEWTRTVAIPPEPPHDD